MSYIDFYFDKNNHLAAELNNGEVHKTVHNYHNLKKLIHVCNKYGYEIDDEGIIEDNYSNMIISDYERWYNSKRRDIYKVTGNIKSKMKINRKNHALGKRLTAAAIATIMTISGVSILHKQTSGQNNVTTQNKTETSTNKTTTSKSPKTETEKIVDNYFNKKDHKETTTKVHKEKKHKEQKQELEDMLKSNVFHFSYENRSNSSNITNAKRYEDIFNKYANKYGLDKNLMMAIAAQESSGDHYNNIRSDQPGKGIMQIEYVHIGETISAYNYETKQNESVTVTNDNIKDLETNIKLGAMILRNSIDNSNCNIPLALQTYNFGPGNINKVLNTCSQSEKIPIEKLKTDNNAWLKYRAFLNIGDKEYVEHVFSYLDNNSNIKILDKDGNEKSITLENDQEKSKQM